MKAEIVQLEAQKADNNKRMNTLPNSNLETVPAVVSKKQEINKIDLEIAKVELQLKNV